MDQHLFETFPSEEFPAITQGVADPPIWSANLETVLREQAFQHDKKIAVIFPWQNKKITFAHLYQRAQVVASGLLRNGIQHGDCVGIIAGNRYEYVEAFAGGALVGCRVLVLNNTYRPWELEKALIKTGCRILFIAPTIGSRSLSDHIKLLQCSLKSNSSLSSLEQLIFFGESPSDVTYKHQSYDQFCDTGRVVNILELSHPVTQPEDIASLQLTSGTTGEPKVAMLSHLSMINNARFVGQRLGINSEDVVCCPPPLFHCFGLVMGFLAGIIQGATVVFPSDHFNAEAVIDSVLDYQCTVLYGVPTMFVAGLEELHARGHAINTVGKGLIAGSTISPTLLGRLRDNMGLTEMAIAYGMTETAPVSFMTAADDALDKRAGTVGRVMPHTKAKVINKLGETVNCGFRGELCVSGHGLQKGYLNNEIKTREVMKYDESNVLWMHTGDECIIDRDGYCHITGRIKDIIIRGGENIFPKEIEDRLASHPSISEASVVGVRDAKYGEVVACFLKSLLPQAERPMNVEVQDWVKSVMSRAQSPQYVFWVGEGGICEDFPTTGSGKHQKHILREIANKSIEVRG